MGNLDLRGLIAALGLLGLAAFFGLAALVSMIAYWRTGDRQRWVPRFLVSVAFGGACLLTVAVWRPSQWADLLDRMIWLWVPAIFVLWLLANRLFGRWVRARGAFLPFD
jgi:4-hydroxybenzoate polyprenyltransferase